MKHSIYESISKIFSSMMFDFLFKAYKYLKSLNFFLVDYVLIHAIFKKENYILFICFYFYKNGKILKLTITIFPLKLPVYLKLQGR